MNDTVPTYADALYADSLDAAPDWIDDGHQIRVTLDCAQFSFAVICPFDATDLTGRDWADLPVCRRAVDEGGQPLLDRSPTASCGLAMLASEFATDEFFDENAPAFEVVSPFAVEYHFGWDGDAVYVRPRQVDIEGLLDATLAPHAVVTTHGGLHWHVTHPAPCDRLPYGAQCLFDLARESRGYELEPPRAEMFIGTPHVQHDHGDGPCVNHDCPVLIGWSSADGDATKPAAVAR